MEAYKQEFIEFMVDCQVLKFGDFTLKSGRKSPFFMNAGAYVTGSQLMRLGARLIWKFSFGSIYVGYSCVCSSSRRVWQGIAGYSKVPRNQGTKVSRYNNK